LTFEADKGIIAKKEARALNKKSRLFLIMTVVQLVVGAAGLVVFFILRSKGVENKSMIATLILAIMLIILGIGDLRRAAAVKKNMNSLPQRDDIVNTDETDIAEQ